MSRRVALLGLLCAFLPPGVANSTIVFAPSFDELVARAQVIFVGEAIGQQAVWESSPQGRAIVTRVSFRVEDVWKGSVAPVTQLEFLGGTIDGVTLEVSGVPAFATGQRSVLFVGGDTHAISPLVGFMHGRLRIERDAGSGIDRVRTFDGRSLGSVADIGRPRPTSLASVTPMRLADLASAVRARVAGGPRQ